MSLTTPQSKIEKAIRLHNDGLDKQSIAERLGIPVSRVVKILTEARKAGAA